MRKGLPAGIQRLNVRISSPLISCDHVILHDYHLKEWMRYIFIQQTLCGWIQREKSIYTQHYDNGITGTSQDEYRKKGVGVDSTQTLVLRWPGHDSS